MEPQYPKEKERAGGITIPGLSICPDTELLIWALHIYLNVPRAVRMIPKDTSLEC